LQTDLGPLLASANRATDNLGNAAGQFEITGTEVNDLIAANRSYPREHPGQPQPQHRRSARHHGYPYPPFVIVNCSANLEDLSTDAAAAMADIRAITSAANTPENLVMLQQTLESARNVFFSAQKVLADVDELTGDPTFRNNIRNLINGLSTLVSLTDDLSNQSRLAQALTPPPASTVERVTLTAISPNLVAQELAQAKAPLLVTHNGQYYRLEVNAPTR
jgi:phospholipid/cholesterol/gamma-HCH transport system substrate-binding protein